MPWASVAAAGVNSYNASQARKAQKGAGNINTVQTGGVGGGWGGNFDQLRDDWSALYNRGPLEFYGPPSMGGGGRGGGYGGGSGALPIFAPDQSVNDLQGMRDNGGQWLGMAPDAMSGFLAQGGNRYDQQANAEIMRLLGGLGTGGGQYSGGYGGGGGGGGGGAGPGRFENLAYDYSSDLLNNPTDNAMMQAHTALNQRLAGENFNRDWAANVGEAAKFGMGSSSALANNQAQASERMGLGLGQANTEALGMIQGLGLDAMGKGGNWENSRVNTNTQAAASRANAQAAAAAQRYGIDMGTATQLVGMLAGQGSDIGGRGLDAMSMLPGFEAANTDWQTAIYDRQYGSERDVHASEVQNAQSRAAAQQRAAAARSQAQAQQYQYEKDKWEYQNYGGHDWLERFGDTANDLSSQFGWQASSTESGQNRNSIDEMMRNMGVGGSASQAAFGGGGYGNPTQGASGGGGGARRDTGRPTIYSQAPEQTLFSDVKGSDTWGIGWGGAQDMTGQGQRFMDYLNTIGGGGDEFMGPPQPWGNKIGNWARDPSNWLKVGSGALSAVNPWLGVAAGLGSKGWNAYQNRKGKG